MLDFKTPSVFKQVGNRQLQIVDKLPLPAGRSISCY